MKKVFRALKYFRNKYLLTFSLFVIWLCFFDKNDLLSQLRLTLSYKQLQQDKTYYMSEIVRGREIIHSLNTDPENLEKFAREKYLMKRKNEDIFLIVPDLLGK